MSGFQRVVLEHSRELSPADRELIELILGDPASAAFMSAESLGERVGVHAATVVRLAKKLGYAGYPAMRSDVQELVRQGFDPANRVVRSLGDRSDSLLDTVVAEEVERLQQLTDNVSDADLESAARLVGSARRVLIYGHGHSGALAELLDRRLRRSGLITERLVTSARDLAESLVSLGPEDVVVGFALRSVPTTLPLALEHASNAGAASIVIADTTGPLLGSQPDVVLAAPRGAHDRFLTLAVPMAICDALVLTLARVDGGASISALERLGELLDLFDA